MREHLKDCRRIVVKVGTSTITYPNGRLNLKRVEELAWVLTDLRNRGKDVILVSSGAIGVGAVRMAMKTRPTAVREKQAAAAVGQAMLMQIYHNFFDRYNQTVAQVLLTKEELSSDSRYENTKNTLETLLEMGIIPIVNANDTISTYEIEITDNDRLSALVAETIHPDSLLLLTDIDALYDKDPAASAVLLRLFQGIFHIGMQSLEVLCILGEKCHSAGNSQLDLQLHLPWNFLSEPFHLLIDPFYFVPIQICGNAVELASLTTVKGNTHQFMALLSQKLKNLISHHISKKIVDSLQSVHVK